MRLYEFAGDDLLDRLITVIRTVMGRYKSKDTPPTINWHSFSNLISQSGMGMAIDYETLKQLHDQYPQLQQLISDFDNKTITFATTGDSSDTGSSDDDETSQDVVDKIAASAAPKQLEKDSKI